MAARFVLAFLLFASCSVTSALFHLPLFPRHFPIMPMPFHGPMAMPFSGFGGGFPRMMVPNVVGGTVIGGQVGVGVGGAVVPGGVGLPVDGDVNFIGGAQAGVNFIGGASLPASRVVYYGDGVDISRPDISDNYLIG